MLRHLLLPSRLRKDSLRFLYSCPHLPNLLLDQVRKWRLVVKQRQGMRLRRVFVRPIDSNADLLRYVHLFEGLLRDDLSLHLNY